MAKKVKYSKRDVKEINVIVGMNLAAARRNAGMSQTDVMKAIWDVSTSRNRISEIETGKKDLTLIDLLQFQELYGQSLDYICGLSVEPEIDMMAGTVNHMVTQSRSMIDMLTGELAGAMVNHLKSICQNDYEALLGIAKELSDVVKAEHKLNRASPDIVKTTSSLLSVINYIEAKQARQAQAVNTQMIQVAERMDAQDKHKLLSDRSKAYQYSLPIPSPNQINPVADAVVTGGKYE
ncbi:helix-turn-helix domain-containing protein [Psychrobacter sp. PAMC 21119]|uniref:helix-turn-helix domain-containing protein n=1 Tax=Psychrobacter sp. PAMC 21119 TaxID=1112209 RepID=UPI000289F572|nr:helix-turn-helix transcriptional regulator [Psychrobacter sp. PAMC 21119]